METRHIGFKVVETIAAISHDVVITLLDGIVGACCTEATPVILNIINAGAWTIGSIKITKIYLILADIVGVWVVGA